jgi:hypothetical protein
MRLFDLIGHLLGVEAQILSITHIQYKVFWIISELLCYRVVYLNRNA